MYKVIKRDGSVVLFDITKIIEAIKRSFVSVERNVDESILNLINPVMEACRAEENLIIRCNSNYVASVESKVYSFSAP